MSTNNLLPQIDHNTPEGGDGILVVQPVPHSEWVLASSGAYLTTTLSTNPGIDKVETNISVFSWAATKVVKAGLTFGCPVDYDETTDNLKLRFLANMSGSTDTGTALDATAYKSGAGTSDLDPTISADLSTTITWVEIDLSGNDLTFGSSIEIQVFPEAHGTDAVQIYATQWEYNSMIVANSIGDRS
jgi:hypothetical protein